MGTGMGWDGTWKGGCCTPNFQKTFSILRATQWLQEPTHPQHLLENGGGGWEGWETSLLDSRNGARNSCMGTYSLSIRSVPGGPRVTSIHSCSPMKWTIRFSHGADEEIWGSILNFPAYKVPAFSTKHTGWYQRVRTFFLKSILVQSKQHF